MIQAVYSSTSYIMWSHVRSVLKYDKMSNSVDVTSQDMGWWHHALIYLYPAMFIINILLLYWKIGCECTNYYFVVLFSGQDQEI